jgi:hypothetical protein
VLLKDNADEQLVDLRDVSADEFAKPERRQLSPFLAVAADVSAPRQLNLTTSSSDRRRTNALTL